MLVSHDIPPAWRRLAEQIAQAKTDANAPGSPWDADGVMVVALYRGLEVMSKEHGLSLEEVARG